MATDLTQVQLILEAHYLKEQEEQEAREMHAVADAAATGATGALVSAELVEQQASAPDNKEDSDDDGMGSYSPNTKQRVEPEEGVAVPQESQIRRIAEKARLAAQEEMKRWNLKQPTMEAETDNAATTCSASRVKMPLIPRKKGEYFHLVQWWMRKGRKDIFFGL